MTSRIHSRGEFSRHGWKGQRGELRKPVELCHLGTPFAIATRDLHTAKYPVCLSSCRGLALVVKSRASGWHLTLPYLPTSGPDHSPPVVPTASPAPPVCLASAQKPKVAGCCAAGEQAGKGGCAVVDGLV